MKNKSIFNSYAVTGVVEKINYKKGYCKIFVIKYGKSIQLPLRKGATMPIVTEGSFVAAPVCIDVCTDKECIKELYQLDKLDILSFFKKSSKDKKDFLKLVKKTENTIT
jgi:hypothetical protein